MRLMISFAALFLSILLLQLGSGGLGPLDAISGLALDFTASQVGLLGSAHFLGFLIGCWWAPRLMGSIGHSRAFAVFTAMGTLGILAHILVANPLAWAGFRILSGICIAGSYTVIEAWLQAKVTNETRGRATGTYRIVDITGSLGAQLFIGILTPGAYVSYTLLAMLCCAALLPLTLTRLPQPPVPEAPRLNPLLAWRCSPLAAMGTLVSGLTAAAFRMVGPIYGVEVGLSTDSIALFLAAFVLGGGLSQYPAGWLADRYDRRWVLIGFSAAGIVACAATVALATGGPAAIMLGAALFGLATYPIYSISVAHAHDFADDTQRVELSAALMFLYAAGAITSPLLVSALIDAFGPPAMFWFVSAVHAALIVWGLSRMRVRASIADRLPYLWSPRTSFTIGNLLRRRRR